MLTEQRIALERTGAIKIKKPLINGVQNKDISSNIANDSNTHPAHNHIISGKSSAKTMYGSSPFDPFTHPIVD